jgi:hypothetical protein
MGVDVSLTLTDKELMLAAMTHGGLLNLHSYTDATGAEVTEA